MKKLALVAAPILLILALGLVGCGKTNTTGSNTGGSSNTVSMTSDNFVQHSVTVKAGQAVVFDDPSTGGTHIICLGKDGTCDKSANGPAELKDPGFQINAGDPSKSVTFDTAGTYDVTCSIHPQMNLTVTVQ
jgi:plastocyanin